MNKNTIKILAKIFISMVIAIGTPIIFSIRLKEYTHISEILLISFILNIIFLFESPVFLFNNKIKKILHWFLIFIYCFGAIIFFIYMILIPYSAYNAWIEYINKNVSAGSISTLYISGVVYFSSLFSAAIYKYKTVLTITGFFFVIGALISIIFQEMMIVILTIIIFVIWLILMVIFSRKDKKKIIFSYFKIITISIILSSLLSIGKLPNTGWMVNSFLSPDLRNFLESIVPITFLSRTSVLFNGGGTSGMGSFYSPDLLGGKSFITNNPVFEIEAKRSEVIYIRTEAFDNYTGKIWEHSEEKLGLTDENKSILKTNIPEKNYIKIKTIIDYLTFIPHTLSTKRIVSSDPNLFGPIYGSMNNGFYFSLPVISGTTFYLENDNSSEIYPLSLEEKELYLDVTGIPQSIVQLSHQLGKDSKSPLETLDNIEEYLSKNYYYTLKTKYPAEDDDFLDDFLFKQKKGYCQHFASAFVILARLHNIPSRYALGYFVIMPSNSDKTICSDITRHAWAEVWLPESGWTIREATPPLLNENMSDSYYWTRNKDSLTLRQLKMIMNNLGRTNGGGREEKNKLKISKINIGLILFLLLIIVLFLFVICFRLLYKNKSPYKGNMKKVHNVTKKLVREMEKKGVIHPDKTGWIAWQGELLILFPELKNKIVFLIDIIQKSFFSESLSSKNDIKYIKLFFRRIRKL